MQKTHTGFRYGRRGAVLLLLMLMSCGGCADDSGPAPADVAAPDSDVMGHAHAPDEATSEPQARSGFGRGEVRALDLAGQSIVVSHGPIEGIGMGAMTMSFLLSEDAAATEVAVGQRIEFDVRAESGDFRITRMCVLPADASRCLKRPD